MATSVNAKSAAASGPGNGFVPPGAITGLDWQRADILLLDMDGTVLDLHFDNHFWAEALPRHYAETCGMQEAQARAELLPRFRAAEGRLDWYCIDYWSRELGLDVMRLKQNYRAGIALLPGAERFLQAQQAAGRRLWLVTNAHPETLRLKLQCSGIDRYFECCLSSHDLGFPKEDARFWPAFAAQCPVSAERSVMIDDNRRVLQTAADFGIGQLVCITRPDTCRPPLAYQGEGMLAVPGLVDLISA